MTVVEGGFDKADDYIAALCDVVITNDIPSPMTALKGRQGSHLAVLLYDKDIKQKA